MTLRTFIHTLSDSVPILVLYIASRFYEFFTAVGIFVVATIITIGLSWWYVRRLPLLPVVVGVFVIVFGSLSIFFQNSNVIIFADSLYYFLGSLILLTSYRSNTLILRSFFGDIFALTEQGWRILTLRWGIFFLLIAMSNEAVRILATPETWIDFKFYKLFFIILFGIYQFSVAKKYRIVSESNRLGLRTKTRSNDNVLPH